MENIDVTTQLNEELASFGTNLFELETLLKEAALY